MTYPQQPPGGHNPYGQPDPGYGPHAQYGTQPYGGGYGGGYGPPPPKKTGVVVAVVVMAVLVLGGLGITGFVAPGFFLSSDDGDGGTAAGPATESSTSESEPTEEAIDEPVEEPTVTEIPAEGGTPTASGKPVDQGALDAMQSFLDSINAGDAADATNHLCTDSISTAADVDELVGYQPDLAIDPAMEGIATGDRSVQLYLQGTAKGQELEGYSTNLWVTSYDGPWCVHAFRAVVI